MERKKSFAVLLLVFVLLIGGAYVLYDRLSAETAAETLTAQETQETDAEAGGTTETEGAAEMRAPDFTVFDAEGNEAKLSDFFGKPIVLNFWASWCGPCKREMPAFNEKFLELGEEVQFLMVNMTDGSQETKEDAEAYLDGQDFSFPVYYDIEMEAAVAYGVWSLPNTYFIDANGNLTAQAKTAIDAETLQKGIDMIAE